MDEIEFLFVTCCRDESRFELLQTVVSNISSQASDVVDRITVFDNASTVPGTIDMLKQTFKHVVVSDANVGYWSAINWWLRDTDSTGRPYTYIIESDMVHYDFAALTDASAFLTASPSVGSVRMHEYSIELRHLYDKDRPRPDSRRSLWQSHTNKVTGKQIEFIDTGTRIWKTTFLTQLPALNRRVAMNDSFTFLREQGDFTEFDFQRRYWQSYQSTGILDGGAFHCNLNPYGSKGVTGSWTDPETLKRIGYLPTRTANIIDASHVRAVRV